MRVPDSLSNDSFDEVGREQNFFNSELPPSEFKMAVLNFLMKEERQSTYTWTVKVDAPHRDFMIIRKMKNVQCSGRFSPPRELLEHMGVADLMFLVRHYLISSSTSVLYFGLCSRD